MKRFVTLNALGLAFGVLFLATLGAQAVAGWQSFNDQQVAAQVGTIGLGDYVTSTDYAVAVAENWQSEFLQFLLYLLATVWLLQQGSPESKQLDKAGLESDEDQMVGEYARPDSPAWARASGWRRHVYGTSLALAMGTIFVCSWLVQSVAGRAAYDEQRLQDLRDPVSWPAYVSSADFWERTLQNWQSEFLAVGAMAVFSIYLRQRGSSQSKPTGAPHAATGIDG
ncbi:DUF6766 family protein [Nocardioides sp. SLBN-35]|uniref:DUF6766 family protein n=1 Tax=Nocardioides sp. SLBN-35 TaxID=2768445 RepID=UPI001153BF67|nr:DUF6766 family protein [Nocardioides sp. SLBN-35]TQK70906.1 hypothetical protein FBY23_2691 [Nocardioides sp. SLBN-35]